MKKLNDYTEEELSKALIIKQKENQEKIDNKVCLDRDEILDFVKKNSFFMITSPSRSSARLYSVDKKQEPKISKWYTGVVRLKLDRYISVSGSYRGGIEEMGASNIHFEINGKKYDKLPEDYNPLDDDENDSSNPSYFWEKIYPSSKESLVPISEEMFEKFWKKAIVYGDDIDLMLDELYK